jgi:hypothetical protein
MLESRDLSGKCADLNALFVGLARAAGLPARDVYGIRTLKSELGYRSLGVSSETVTRAQHCRAEVTWTITGGFPSIRRTSAKWRSRSPRAIVGSTTTWCGAPGPGCSGHGR